MGGGNYLIFLFLFFLFNEFFLFVSKQKNFREVKLMVWNLENVECEIGGAGYCYDEKLDDKRKEGILKVLKDYLSKCKEIDEKYPIKSIVTGTEEFSVFEFERYGRVLVLIKFGYSLVVFENEKLLKLLTGAGRILKEKGIPNSIILRKGNIFIDIVNGKIIKTKDIRLKGSIKNGEVKLASIIVKTRRNIIPIENWRGKYVNRWTAEIEIFDNVEPLVELGAIRYKIKRNGKYLSGELEINEERMQLIKVLTDVDKRAVVYEDLDELIYQLENKIDRYMEEKKKIAYETIDKITEIAGVDYVDLIFEPFNCEDVKRMIEKIEAGKAELRIGNNTIYCYYF
jgi:hypothetical protein